MLRRVLDDRLSVVARRNFRVDGKSIRKPKSVFSDVDMSACEKAVVIFLLSYVLGPSGDGILPGRVITPLRTAVAHAQLILIAVSGGRMYTKEELHVIFDRAFLTIFAALETIWEWEYNVRVQQSIDDSVPPPKRFKRDERLHVINANIVFICANIISYHC